MPALVAGIHALLALHPSKKDVDGRDKPGHDELKERALPQPSLLSCPGQVERGYRARRDPDVKACCHCEEPKATKQSRSGGNSRITVHRKDRAMMGSSP